MNTKNITDLLVELDIKSDTITDPCSATARSAAEAIRHTLKLQSLLQSSSDKAWAVAKSLQAQVNILQEGITSVLSQTGLPDDIVNILHETNTRLLEHRES